MIFVAICNKVENLEQKTSMPLSLTEAYELIHNL